MLVQACAWGARVSTLALALHLTLSCSDAGAAWPQPEGQVLAITRLEAEEVQATGPDGRDDARYGATLYAVYGWTPRLSLGFAARALADLPDEPDERTEFRADSLEPFVRAQVARVVFGAGEWVTSVETRIGAPVADMTRRLGEPSSQVWTGEIRLLGGVSQSLGGSNVFAVGEGAFRSRFGRGEDDVRLAATVGLQAGPVMLLGQAFSTLRMGAPLTPDTARSDTATFQGSAVLAIGGGTSLEAGVRHETILGGGGHTRAVFAGIWQRF